MDSTFRRDRSPSRSGMAMIIAMGLLVMLAALIMTSSEGAVANVKTASAGKHQLQVLAALDAVLSRRELRIIEMAEAGDPAQFSDWTENYGLEYFGECEVRWRVEPVRSAPRKADGSVIPFIANPSPDINWSAPTDLTCTDASTGLPVPAWRTNDTVYLFRVSAEARICTDDGSNLAIEGETVARAQGARYVSVKKEPLFRYVIFYAQQGPKGDLELSHGPSVRVMGNVHSNGSIYLGAGTETNDWAAVRPTNGDTLIGAMTWDASTAYAAGDKVRYLDSATGTWSSYTALLANTNRPPPGNTASWQAGKDARVRVTGVDGIFRLAKPAMYGLFNGYPMKNPGWAPGALAAGHYDLSAVTPIDGQDGPRTSIANATFSGAFINPYRVTADSRLVTSPASQSPAEDVKRTINGTPLTGDWTGSLAGNDARDLARAAAAKWNPASLGAAPAGFEGLARTRATGGSVKQLPETLASRPLEPQAVGYPDPAIYTAGNAAYHANRAAAYRARGDEHRAALPTFIASDDGQTTSTDHEAVRGASRGVIEAPGQYVRYALGSEDAFFRRNLDAAQGFIGWRVTKADGTAISTASLPTAMGLIIRERPVPDFSYFGMDASNPGSYLPDRSAGGSSFLPYGYGKHKDTTLWPCTEFYATANATGWAAPASGNGDDAVVALDTGYLGMGYSTQRYVRDQALGGVIEMTTAVRRGATGSAPTASPSNLDVANDDQNGWFRDNWRLLHLKRVRANVSNAAKPVVDLTKADSFFSRSTFRGVQVRLVPDATGSFLPNYQGSPDQPLAGLMVRPFNTAGTGTGTAVDLTAAGLNGRDPQVVLAFSPGRGIVVQRRFHRSQPVSVPINASYTYYTACGTGLGEEAPPLSTRITRTLVSSPVATTFGTATLIKTDTDAVQSPSISETTNGGTSLNLPSANKSTGEGTVTRPSYNFVRGPYQVIANYTWKKKSAWYYQLPVATLGSAGIIDYVLTTTRTGDFLTSAPTPGSLSSWSGRPAWINLTASAWTNPYADPPAASYQRSLGNLNTSTRQIINATTLRLTWATNATGAVNGSTATTWSSGYSQNGYVRFTNGDSATLYTNQGDYVTAKSWYTARGLTETDLRNDIKAAYPAITTFASLPTVVKTDPATPSPSSIPAAPTPAPAIPATPGIGSAPDSPVANGTYTFAIRRGGSAASSIRVETNSWVSARGGWNHDGTAPRQYLYLRDGTPAGEALTPNLSPTPGQTRSFRPDYFTGAIDARFQAGAFATAWGAWSAGIAGMATRYYPLAAPGVPPTPSAFEGSIVPGTYGCPNSYGSTVNAPWEDAQIPTWSSGRTYVAENAATSTNASAVLVGGIPYVCVSGHTATASDTPATSAKWVKATSIYLRIDYDHGAASGAGAFLFRYYVGTGKPSSDTDFRWRWVCKGLTRGADGMPVDRLAGTTTMGGDALTWTDNRLPTSGDGPVWPDATVVALAAQANSCSGSTANSVKVRFADMRVDTSSPDATDRSPSGGDNRITSADWEADVQLPVAAGADLTGRTVDNATAYLCSQYQVFLGPLEITEDFFSYTRNGSGLDADRAANEKWFYNTRFYWSQSRWWNEGDLDLSTWLPVPRSAWVEKESGTTTPVGASVNQYGVQREYLARSTVLDLDLGNLQQYLKTRTLAQAAYRWTSNSSQGVTASGTVASRFTGLLYAARTNRYPRNPTPTRANPWNPDLPNVVPVGSQSTDLVDLYDGLTSGVDSRTGSTYGNTYTATAPKTAVRERLVAPGAADRGTLCAPIPWEDFHHGVMLSNGSAIDWGWTSSATTFGTGKTSIVTPNTLYLRGDLNNTKLNVTWKGSVQAKWTPLAVMGDSVTLLSNGWDISLYQAAGIAVDEGKVTSGGILSRISGRPATDTSYRACILTNNQPTNRYRVFQGEGAPFINTLQFLEDWGNGALYGTPTRTMEFTGSLVVLDSCRYTRSFLLQDARTDGRSPYGMMGWHCDDWSALTGWTGGGPDWCKAGTTRMPPSGTSNSASSPYGSLPVYWPPTRLMSFNDDLTTEEGTPPNTPFGVTASGVGGWMRVVQ